MTTKKQVKRKNQLGIFDSPDMTLNPGNNSKAILKAVLVPPRDSVGKGNRKGVGNSYLR